MSYLQGIDDELIHTRDLVMRYGWNATSYQIVNKGIRRWFSQDGEAVVGYVLKNGVRVVAGAPVCSLAQLDSVIDQWEEDAQRHGHRVCYFGAAGRVEALLRNRPGYSTVILGAQPVWKPRSWKGLVESDASLRAQLNRARNKGVSVEEWSSERATNNPGLSRCLQEWLQTRGLPPLHFLVEPQTLSFMADRRAFVAVQNERPIGFAVLCPVPRRNGWLTEQFPRGKCAPNGTVECLLDAAVRAAAVDGSDYLTMGLVPLSQKAASLPETPLWLKGLLAWVRAHGRRFYNFDGLEWFKTKFHPEEWEPIYAISKEDRFSFRTLYAVAYAFSDVTPIIALSRGLVKAVRQEVTWFFERSLKRFRKEGPGTRV